MGYALWKKAEDFDRTDASHIKPRINFFQLAASAFEFLRKTIAERNLSGLLSDLSAESAEILSKICLIRAQMGFISKCKSNFNSKQSKIKPTICLEWPYSTTRQVEFYVIYIKKLA